MRSRRQTRAVEATKADPHAANSNANRKPNLLAVYHLFIRHCLYSGRPTFPPYLNGADDLGLCRTNGWATPDEFPFEFAAYRLTLRASAITSPPSGIKGNFVRQPLVYRMSCFGSKPVYHLSATLPPAIGTTLESMSSGTEVERTNIVMHAFAFVREFVFAPNAASGKWGHLLIGTKFQAV